MTLQTSTSTALTTSVVPPATPTLTFNPVVTVSASSATILDAAASVNFVGNTTDRFIQIALGQAGGKLGILNGGPLITSGAENGVRYDFNPTTNVLSLDGSAAAVTDENISALLKKVAFDATGSTITGQSISVNLGRPVYLSSNGHYYEFVPFTSGQSIPWTDAKTEASKKNFLGLGGYLATVTTGQENAFMQASFASKGWISGISSITGTGTGSTRTWKWDAGPEVGKTFWTENVGTLGEITGGTSVGTNTSYANWASGEPNNFGTTKNTPLGNNEGFAHLLKDGTWNDLANSPSAGQDANFKPDGYWVEYSKPDGSPDDTLSGTRKTFTVTVTRTPAQDPNALDLVFYDEVKGQVSFAFVGANNNIVKLGLDLNGDTPALASDPSGAAPTYSNLIQMVSANVDVDQDGTKDVIVRHTVSGRTYVVFGEARTGSPTERAYAYKRVATVTYPNGVPLDIPNYSIDFASDKLGVNNTPGFYWRNGRTGDSGIHSLTVSTDKNGAPIVISTLAGKGVNLGPNTGWRAVGDGEFNSDTTTREIFWVNDITGKTVTWSLNSTRQNLAIKSLKAGTVDLIVPTSAWRVAGIGNLNLAGNDEVIWQSGATVVIWKMTDSQWSGSDFFSLPQVDRIKAIANTELTTAGIPETLELVGQNDVDGTTGFYKLNFVDNPSGGKYTLNTVRRSYTANNVVYRPGKGSIGTGLELVNVAQYDKLLNT